MALQSMMNINIDFYDNKYILINAKQFDKKTRFLSVTCYNHGELFLVDYREHSAYIRYKKADDYGVFNFCEITKDGKILIELTEQMLASSGICTADIVIVNRGQAEVDTETGEIVNIDRASVLSTMTFYIDVFETSVENSEIESSYEYSAFNQSLENYWADFEKVMQTSKSYAVGNAGGIRENENFDNAKYYYELALTNANASSDSANAAAKSEANAKTSEINAANSEANAKVYKENANTYMNNAEDYMEASKVSESAANEYAEIAKNNMDSAISSASDASTSASSASVSASNAYNYYLQAEAIVNGLNGAFLPMGTIMYSELASLKESGTVAAGYLYNISDNFTTDETFKMGAGVEYEAGTNVYYTADGYWDCLAGATVTGVKGSNETIYRKGNVELTAENVGAIPSANIATVDEAKTYLGIN